MKKTDKLKYELDRQIYFEYIFTILMVIFLIIFIFYIIISTFGDYQLNEKCEDMCFFDDSYLVSYELRGNICHCYYPNSIKNFEVER